MDAREEDGLNVKEQLSGAIADAAAAAVVDGALPQGILPEVFLEVPPEKSFGDYATNFAMQAARTLKANPRKIAEAIVTHLQFPWLDRAEIAGPGFINFYLKPDWLYELLQEILEQGETYGNTQAGRQQKIQIEFVSANPTGPLHVGHGRGAAFGSALANLMRAAGYDVQKEFYINDAGNQIDNLALSVEARYLELLGQTVEFPEDGYHGRDIIDTAQRIVDNAGNRYLVMGPAERREIFKQIALAEKLAALKEDLESFGVTFDVWFSERSLFESDLVAAACAELRKKGHAYDKDGAFWLRSTDFGDDKDRVIIRDNGIPTYFASDIAYHDNKFHRGFEKVINIWGADHHGYIPRMKAAMAALGYEPDRLEVLILQMVSLYQGGELVKMSKRTGQGVTLTELIEEVGRDAARYFFIMRSLDSQLDFDLDLAKSHSNDNPVYYVQYAYARIASILRQMEEAGIAFDSSAKAELSRLSSEFELDLIRKLGDYPAEISAAARDRAPHRIARYAHELAGLFHSFYNGCRVLGVEPELTSARLALVTATQRVLRHCLGILGVDAPEKM
ncbi:MAG: argS [Firmicutes bacterium]|nr:argS [Bacillota bacterium]